MAKAEPRAEPRAEPLTALKDLGPESAAMLREVGAATADKRLQHHSGHRVYALEGAPADRHWNSHSPRRRSAEGRVRRDLEVGAALNAARRRA